MPRTRIYGSLSLATLVLLSGCSASKMTHDDYMNYDGMMKRFLKQSEVTLNVPFATALKRLQSQSDFCAPKRYTETTYQSNGLMKTNIVNNNITIKQISATQAKYSVQQHHSNMIMQPKAGMFFAAADLNATPTGKTQVKIVSQHASWQTSIPAWIRGETKCFGIGGKK